MKDFLTLATHSRNIAMFTLNSLVSIACIVVGNLVAEKAELQEDMSGEQVNES